jgi:hypothetical protein
MTAGTRNGPPDVTQVRAPLIGAETWHAVVDQAGERCQCRGQCGRRHLNRERPKAEPRCVRLNGQGGKPLHAIPRTHLTEDTAGTSGRTAWSASARLPAAELAAVCESCHAGIDAARTARARAATDPPALF